MPAFRKGVDLIHEITEYRTDSVLAVENTISRGAVRRMRMSHCTLWWWLVTGCLADQL